MMVTTEGSDGDGIDGSNHGDNVGGSDGNNTWCICFVKLILEIVINLLFAS